MEKTPENSQDTPEIPATEDTEEETKGKDIFLYSDPEEKEENPQKNQLINYKNLISTEIKKVEILDTDQKSFDLNFKTILIGNTGVGKSCLSLKATKGIFKEDFTSTLGFEFFSFNVKINNTIIKLQIWDTCGQEIYRSLIAGFYRSSSLAVIVYSVTDKQSFEDVDIWLKQVKTHGSLETKIFLIGNKADLPDRVVSSEEGIKCKEENGMECFMETSAKTGFNARELFVNGAISLYLEHLKYMEEAKMEEKEEDNFRLKDNENLKIDDEGCNC